MIMKIKMKITLSSIDIEVISTVFIIIFITPQITFIKKINLEHK